MLPSFHCTQANPQFHSAPLWLSYPTFRNSKPKREAALHPIPFAPLHSVTTLASSNPISGISCDNVYPEKTKVPKLSERPSGISEVKEYGRVGEHVLENAGFET
jgi:hypothetical protein